jgi:uncharacterized protein
MPMRRTAAAAAAVALSAGAMIAAMPTQAEAHDGREAQRIDGTSLVITAEARVDKAPDLANVTAGVLTEGRTADAALAENAKRMTGVMAALRQAGVADRDIQTSNLNLNPQYVYRENEAPRITGYQASNTVNVRVRNLTNLGRTLDSLIGQGGNQLHGVSFSLDKADDAMDEARRDAMKRARGPVRPGCGPAGHPDCFNPRGGRLHPYPDAYADAGAGDGCRRRTAHAGCRWRDQPLGQRHCRL